MITSQDAPDVGSALQDKRERALDFLFSQVDMINAVGLELLAWDENSAVVRMPYSEFVDNRSGTALGGALCTLIDIAGAAVVWAGHDFAKGSRHATVGMSVNFIGTAGKRAVIATARCVRRARELNFIDIDLVSEGDERTVASAMMTFRVVKAEQR